MCNWLTMLYSRKLTEHYKPAMMEKIKILKKEKKRKKYSMLEKRKSKKVLNVRKKKK